MHVTGCIVVVKKKMSYNNGCHILESDSGNSAGVELVTNYHQMCLQRLEDYIENRVSSELVKGIEKYQHCPHLVVTGHLPQVMNPMALGNTNIGPVIGNRKGR